MAKTSGYTLYACDRCGKRDYVAAGSPTASEWRDIQRVTADGVQTGMLLCKECNEDYKKLAQRHDSEFNEFVSEGREEQ